MNLFITAKPAPLPKTFFIPVRNYHESPNSIVAWGCQCPECGAFHEFTFGAKWNFCPACGCDATEKKYEAKAE